MQRKKSTEIKNVERFYRLVETHNLVGADCGVRNDSDFWPILKKEIIKKIDQYLRRELSKKEASAWASKLIGAYSHFIPSPEAEDLAREALTKILYLDTDLRRRPTREDLRNIKNELERLP